MCASFAFGDLTALRLVTRTTFAYYGSDGVAPLPILTILPFFFKLNRMGLGIPYYRSRIRLRRGGSAAPLGKGSAPLHPRQELSSWTSSGSSAFAFGDLPALRLERNLRLLLMSPAEWLRCPILLSYRSFFKLHRMGLGIPYYRSGIRLRRRGALLHTSVRALRPYILARN